MSTMDTDTRAALWDTTSGNRKEECRKKTDEDAETKRQEDESRKMEEAAAEEGREDEGFGKVGRVRKREERWTESRERGRDEREEGDRVHKRRSSLCYGSEGVCVREREMRVWSAVERNGGLVARCHRDFLTGPETILGTFEGSS